MMHSPLERPGCRYAYVYAGMHVYTRECMVICMHAYTFANNRPLCVENDVCVCGDFDELNLQITQMIQ